MSNIMKYEDVEPQIAENVYVAPGAFVIGDVELGANSNIWFNTVLRGDIEKIKVGKFTNIQDNSTVHVMGDCPAIIGDYVTVGHGAIVHGCTIKDNVLVNKSIKFFKKF